MNAAKGRGRGSWGSITTLGPPGVPPPARDEEANFIMEEIARLDINDREMFETVKEEIKRYCVDTKNLWRICQKMYDSGENDRYMVLKVIKILIYLSTFKVNNVKMRSVFLTIAEHNFEERIQLRRFYHKRFLNSIAIFGGLFHHIVIPGRRLFKELISVLKEYIELLLSERTRCIAQREAELETLVYLVNLNGKALKEHAKETLDGLRLYVRKYLATSFTSPRCRYWLILLQDLSIYGWSIGCSPNDLKIFYSEVLDTSYTWLTTSDHLKRPFNAKAITPLTTTDEEETSQPEKPEHEVSNARNEEITEHPFDWQLDDRFEDLGPSYTEAIHPFSGEGKMREEFEEEEEFWSADEEMPEVEEHM